MSADELLSTITKQMGVRVRLAPGVVGKGGMMWTALIGAWAVALLRMSPDHLVFDGIIGGVMLLVTGVVMRETGKMREYGKQNPAAALLEGAEFVEFKRFEAQAKDLPHGDPSIVVAPVEQLAALPKPPEPQP